MHQEDRKSAFCAHQHGLNPEGRGGGFARSFVEHLILSPENYIRYTNRLGLGPPVVFEHQNNGPLQFDLRQAWPEMRMVAEALMPNEPLGSCHRQKYAGNEICSPAAPDRWEAL